MAEEKQKSQRVYRRKPEDIAEAKFIAGLISKFVDDSTVQLANEGKHDQLYVIIGYRRTWQEIVKELESESTTRGAEPLPSIGPPCHVADETPVKLGDEIAPGVIAVAGTDATGEPSVNLYAPPSPETTAASGGDRPRSRTRTAPTA